MRESSSVRQAISTAGKGLLVVILVPLAAVAAQISTVFSTKEKRTASEVADYLRNFLEDEPGEPWAWDDFTSVPIADPQLDAIRVRAAAIDQDRSEAATNTLRHLLAEAEGLAAQEAQE